MHLLERGFRPSPLLTSHRHLTVFTQGEVFVTSQYSLRERFSSKPTANISQYSLRERFSSKPSSHLSIHLGRGFCPSLRESFSSKPSSHLSIHLGRGFRPSPLLTSHSIHLGRGFRPSPLLTKTVIAHNIKKKNAPIKESFSQTCTTLYKDCFNISFPSLEGRLEPPTLWFLTN